MSLHTEASRDDVCVDPRYPAQRANLYRNLEGDDPAPSGPRNRLVGEQGPGIIPQDPSQTVDYGAGVIEDRAGFRPDETRSFVALRSRKREILSEQRTAWDAGRPVPPEDLLRRWPTDPAGDPDVAAILVEDFLKRQERGESPSLDEYQVRFPELSRSMASEVSRHDAFRNLGASGSSPGSTLRLPDVGDEVFGFRLNHPLGKGAFARVFLAGQDHLAGRPVVLKVSGIEGTEPQTLAQLQHTNIVPIYSVHDDLRAGLRAVCMPYFGGASLLGVLKELFDSNPKPRLGREFVDALEAVQAPEPDQAAGHDKSSPSAGQTPLATLAGLDYVRATIWVAARLAEGLQHAHQRGVLHRDIKPANILVSAEGQPLLLDFNLAQNRNADPVRATIGGTIAYMAPEHLRAIFRRTTEDVQRVDHRSDIYSLGMVIAEMLTGHNPFEQIASYSAFSIQIEAMALDRSKQAPSVRASRPDVPWGLESVVRKCLAPDPSARYQEAGHLAEDLRRLLDDRPLKYAPELSLPESCRKWARRHPRLTTAVSVVSAASVALVVLAATLAGVSGRLDRTRDRLGAFQSRERLKAHDEGTSEALTLVNTVIGREDLLRQGLSVGEKTLALYDSPSESGRRAHPDWSRLNADERRRVAEDRRELLLLTAGARVLLAPGDRRALRGAVERLEKAEAVPGLKPSKALWNDRARYLALLGDEEGAKAAQRRADRTPVHTANDFYLLAASYARRGGPADYGRAIEELNKSLRINPRHYWSLVLRGICRLEKGDYVSASGDFGLCAGLRPDIVWGCFNRGCVLDRSGRKAEAVEDYASAVERDPRFVPARINRGLALLELRRYAEALVDFDAARALKAGGEVVTISAGRGMALEGLGRHEEADAEFARAFGGDRAASSPDRDRLLWTYGFAVSARLPSKAHDAFQEVLLKNPRHPQALYGLAMLSMTEGRPFEAVEFFDGAIRAAPEFVEARRYRSIALARSFAWERASRDVRWCLEREPASGEALYAAACVSSLAAGEIGKPETFLQSLGLLRQALDRGIGLGKFASDPDLSALRSRPEFQRLLVRYRAETAPPRDR